MKSEQYTSQMLTVKEAADIARVGKNTMYTLVNSGQLPCIRIGHVIRINRLVLFRFLGIEENFS